MAKTRFDQVVELLEQIEQTASRAASEAHDTGAVPLFDLSKIESLVNRLASLITIKRELPNAKDS